MRKDLVKACSKISPLSIEDLRRWRNRKFSKARKHVETFRREESHLVGTGVRGHDLPAVVKLMEVHRGVPNHLLVGTREIDGPPS